MLDLNEDNFEPFVAGEGVRLVLFGAASCRPAREQRHELEGIENTSAAARLAAIDALSHDGLRRKLDIRRLPSTIVFRDGKVVQSLAGFQPRSRIEAVIKRFIPEPNAVTAL
jgi:thioredoxin 1